MPQSTLVHVDVKTPFPEQKAALIYMRTARRSAPCTVYWNCPCASGSKSNNFQIQDRDAEEYMVSVAPWNTNSEALDNVEVEVAKKD